MWRSFFLAMGVYCCLLGVEALAVERAVLKPEVSNNLPIVAGSDIVPTEWAPWSMMAGGAVVMLYSFTIPLRVRKD